MKKLFLLLIFFLSTLFCFGQNPFEKFDYKPKIGSLSQGKYIEHFDNDSIVQIGTIMLNIHTNVIEAFIIQEVRLSEADLEPEIVSRWMNPDPLADEFPDKSPYNFVNNDPIRYIDPEGLAPQDIIIDGDEKFRQSTLAHLQSLTNDELTIDNNGKVTIANSNNQNCDCNLPEGTALVAELIGSDKVVTITTAGKGGNQTEAEVFDDAFIKGKGSNSTVEFDPNLLGGENIFGRREKSGSIGLAHELFHAKDMADGTRDIGYDTDFIVPYSENNDGVEEINNFGPLNNEEVRARRSENRVRSEQKLPARVFKRRKDFKRRGKF